MAETRAKMALDRNYLLRTRFRASRFQNFPVEDAPRPPSGWRYRGSCDSSVIRNILILRTQKSVLDSLWL